MRRTERALRDETAVGSSTPATEWILVVSSASSKVSGARIDGRRFASMVLPKPGEQIMKMLWLQAAATSRERLAVCCPRTSLKSREKCCSSPSRSSVLTRNGSRNGADDRGAEEVDPIEERTHRKDVHALDHSSFSSVGDAEDLRSSSGVP